MVGVFSKGSLRADMFCINDARRFGKGSFGRAGTSGSMMFACLNAVFETRRSFVDGAYWKFSTIVMWLCPSD